LRDYGEIASERVTAASDSAGPQVAAAALAAQRTFHSLVLILSGRDARLVCHGARGRLCIEHRLKSALADESRQSPNRARALARARARHVACSR